MGTTPTEECFKIAGKTTYVQAPSVYVLFPCLDSRAKFEDVFWTKLSDIKGFEGWSNGFDDCYTAEFSNWADTDETLLEYVRSAYDYAISNWKDGEIKEIPFTSDFKFH